MSTSTLEPKPSAPVREYKPRGPQKNPGLLGKTHSAFHSDIFPAKTIVFKAGNPEIVVIGGRDQFFLIEQAFDNAGIKQILFYGWGSQGPAQAENLRDTLRSIGSDIKVCVGLRPGSKSIPAAKAAGFTPEDGTFGDPYELAKTSDLVICLVSDGGMVETYERLFGSLKPGAIIGISHGFIVAHLKSIDRSLPARHDVIMVAPKGMGPSVRKLYLQGAETEGAGINSSVAVSTYDPHRHQLVQEVAIAWSVGIGSPVTFGTDFLSEVTSDLSGERAMLLGGLFATAEVLYDHFLELGKTPDQAFLTGVSGITGTITDELSKYGIKGLFDRLTPEEEADFVDGYVLAYPAFDEVIGKIYDDVASMKEIQKVIEATKALPEHPMEDIEAKHPMWKYAREHKLYGARPSMDKLGFVFGFYAAGIMAQLHTLLHHGHAVSEVINESFIEAIDSLTPYMDSRGVAFMVDNCSTTARLGTRLWAPVFRESLKNALKKQPLGREERREILKTFFDEGLHHDIGLCMKLRPSVRISIPLVQ